MFSEIVPKTIAKIAKKSVISQIVDNICFVDRLPRPFRPRKDVKINI